MLRFLIVTVFVLGIDVLQSQTLIDGRVTSERGKKPAAISISVQQSMQAPRSISCAPNGSFAMKLSRPSFQDILFVAPKHHPLRVPLLVTRDDDTIQIRVRLSSMTGSHSSDTDEIVFDIQHSYLAEMSKLADAKEKATQLSQKQASEFISRGGRLADFRPDYSEIVRLLLRTMNDSSHHVFVRQYAAILAMDRELLQTTLKESTGFYDFVTVLVPPSSWIWASDPRKIISLCNRSLEPFGIPQSIPQLSLSPSSERKSPKTPHEAIDLHYWNQQRTEFTKFLEANPSRIVKAEVLRFMASNARAHHFPEFPQLFQKLKAFKDIPFIANYLRDLDPKNSVVLGTKAPEIRLKLMGSGALLSNSELRGKFVLIDFWATWCVPCASAIRYLQEMYPSYSRRGLEIVSISFDSDTIAIQNFRTQFWAMPWLHAWEPRGFNSDLGKSFHVTGLPRLVILSPEGKIVESGSLWGQPLMRKLDELLRAHASRKVR